MNPKEFRPPTKEEIRDRYGIKEDDFDILVSNDMPDPKSLEEEETLLEKVLDFFGVPTFLKRLKKTGVILAIVFMPYWGPKVTSEIKVAVVTSYDFYSDVLDRLPKGDSTSYAILIPGEYLSESKLDFTQLPPGTGIASLSAAIPYQS